MTRWSIDSAALDLLERAGGPFSLKVVRQTLVDTFPGWSDASIGLRMSNGTTAALGLIDVGNRIESIPYGYGGLVASRRLRSDEVATLLDFVRRQRNARVLECRSVPIGNDDFTRHDSGTVVGWSHVVHLSKGQPPSSRWAYKARRAVRIAREAGGVAAVGFDPEPFLRLYRQANISHVFRLPDEVIEGLAKAGALRFYQVGLRGQTVSSVAALSGGSHWMALLGAQDESGRKISGNYLAVATLLEDAYRRGVPAVNLGISTGMPTVAHFKRRFDAVEVPVIRHSSVSAGQHAATSAKRYRFKAGRALTRVARVVAPRSR